MAPYSGADVASFLIRELGAFLACVALVALWRRSRNWYFGLFATAFALRLAAGIFVFERWGAALPGWLRLYAASEFAVLAAAAAGLAMWGGRHANRVRELCAEMDSLRRKRPGVSIRIVLPAC